MVGTAIGSGQLLGGWRVLTSRHPWWRREASAVWLLNVTGPGASPTRAGSPALRMPPHTPNQDATTPAPLVSTECGHRAAAPPGPARGLAEAGAVTHSAAGDPHPTQPNLTEPDRTQAGVQHRRCSGLQGSTTGGRPPPTASPGGTCYVRSQQACARTPRPCNDPRGVALAWSAGPQGWTADVGRTPSRPRPRLPASR